MMLLRLFLLMLVLFILFYSFLKLCFTKGYLNKKRLSRWTHAGLLTFASVMLVAVAMTIMSGADSL